MAPPDDDMGALARPELADGHRPLVIVEVEPEPATQHHDRLVLLLVVLEGEPPTSLDHEDLAAVAIREGPDQLVPPRLVHAARFHGPRSRPARLAHLAHDPRTSRSPASSNASRSWADVASVYTRTSGSVPLARTRSHDPSSSKNFTPSYVESGN